MQRTRKAETSCIDPQSIDAANAALARLKSARLTVVTAESCTGGLLSAVLSQAKDAGEVLHGGFVTYSKRHKAQSLGVDAGLLESRGSVNAEVVNQLMQGALARSPADIAIAVSGVLGPSADEDGSPVGLVYFGICRRGRAPVSLRKDYGEKSADVLRRTVVCDALHMLAAHAAS